MTPVPYLAATLLSAGIITFLFAAAHAADRLQRHRGWTLAMGLLAFGTLVNIVSSGTAEIEFSYGLFAIGFAATAGYTGTKAAIPCLFGRHPDSVVNKISAVTDDGEIVAMDVQWSPDALGDRELLLGSLLRHGAVVDTRCAACGTPRPRHTGV